MSEKNKDKMIVIDSGSHLVYNGTKNERQKLKEFIDVVKILKNQGASPIIIHHSHRVRDSQIADYHGVSNGKEIWLSNTNYKKWRYKHMVISCKKR